MAEADAEGEPYVEYAVGDEITPTESELESFPFRFEPIEEEEDEEEPEGESEEGETESETGETPDLDEMDYDDLQDLAGEYDEIDGRWGEDRLRSELRDQIEG